MKRWGKWVAALAAMLLGAWVIATLVGIVAAQQESREDRARLEAEVDKLTEQARADRVTAEALQQQVRALGEDPVVEPSEVPRDDSVVLLPGPRGLSCIEEIGYPRCRGARGDDSTVAGPKGDDSTVPGPRGASCVEELGVEACRGEEGKPGKDGVDGKDGRSIKSTYCGDDGRWDITYTDGTTEDGGVCRLAPGNPNEGAARR